MVKASLISFSRKRGAGRWACRMRAMAQPQSPAQGAFPRVVTTLGHGGYTVPTGGFRKARSAATLITDERVTSSLAMSFASAPF